ncbi:MAG: TRCF domain-containing protein, partial [Clostridiales bacterium]
LYQLRGRVGRSSRQAFAYFTYGQGKIMTEVAKKRLIAIRDFTELGAGFKIAMRDMEIRGAGNILGPQQHGNIEAVGFDLYCRLLQEEIRHQSGSEGQKEEINTLLELNIDAYLPDQYIDDSLLKMEIYKRISGAADTGEIDELAEELLDRYGKISPVVENLLLLGKVKACARTLRILSIIQKDKRLELKLAPDHPLEGDHLISISNKWGKRINFYNKKDFIIQLNIADILKEVKGSSQEKNHRQDKEKMNFLLRFLKDLLDLLS